MATALRTDGHAFRRLALADPVVIELREWSRIAEDLTAERTRLANRMREQLWRYFPQMLAVQSDVASPWLIDLWQAVPTPEKAARVRESSIARILKDNRTRKTDAASVLAALRAKPVQVAPGTTDAAVAHVRRTSFVPLRFTSRALRRASSEPREKGTGANPAAASRLTWQEANNALFHNTFFDDLGPWRGKLLQCPQQCLILPANCAIALASGDEACYTAAASAR